MTAESQSKLHWLVRPSSIRRLWIGAGVLLGLSVAVQLLVPVKGKFDVDGWLAFPAVYGFLSCVAMVVGAKLLGMWLKRRDDYYDA